VERTFTVKACASRNIALMSVGGADALRGCAAARWRRARTLRPLRRRKRRSMQFFSSRSHPRVRKKLACAQTKVTQKLRLAAYPHGIAANAPNNASPKTFRAIAGLG
jgi:hypothetical protein